MLEYNISKGAHLRKNVFTFIKFNGSLVYLLCLASMLPSCSRIKIFGSNNTGGGAPTRSPEVTISSDFLLIADTRNNVVRKLVYSTGVITTFAGTGAASYSGDGGLATQATFTTPSSIVTDSSGNTYIEDSDNQVIRKIDSNGIITTIAGVAGNGDWSGDGGLATAAHIGNPTQLALDNSGNLLFVDYNNCVLRSINLSTSIISTLAGDNNCQIANSGDGGLATAASFYDPHGVVVDTLGNIYIADVGSLIRKIDANTGIISTYAGTYNNPGYTGDGGLASAALLNAPVWLAVDRYNNLYIADSGNSSIRKVDYNTKIITTVAGT